MTMVVYDLSAFTDARLHAMRGRATEEIDEQRKRARGNARAKRSARLRIKHITMTLISIDRELERRESAGEVE